MKPVVFSPAASADLKAIGLYIAEDNPDRAVTFVAELEMRAQDRRAPTRFPGQK